MHKKLDTAKRDVENESLRPSAMVVFGGEEDAFKRHF